MKKVVVTGATSMLGSALLRRLICESDIEAIYAVVRPLGDSLENKRYRIPVNEKIHIIECNMSDYSSLHELIDDTCDVFYHMAWPRTATYVEDVQDILTKCDALKCVFEALNEAHIIGCHTFVGAGTQAEYGIPTNGYYSADMECNPVRNDGILHLCAKHITQNLADQFGMNCIWMRIFSVYGLYDRENSMVSSTLNKLIRGEHCSFTKSEQTWDYINADDAAEAFYLVGKKVKKHAIYNISSGVSKPLKEFIETIRDIAAPEAELGFGEIEYPPNPIMKMSVDISNLVEDTGWQPKVSFKQGILDIYNFKVGNVIDEH